MARISIFIKSLDAREQAEIRFSRGLVDTVLLYVSNDKGNVIGVELENQEAIDLARGLLNAADLNERAKGGY